MAEISFWKLLRNKGIPQEALAQKLNVPVETIQDWAVKEQLPEFRQIKALADILQEQEETLFGIFKPDTHAEKAKADEKEISRLLEEVFYIVRSPQDLIEFSFFFAVRPSKGLVSTGDDSVFFFTAVRSEQDGTAVSFSDESDNLIVLTKHNMACVKPVTVRYDVFMFKITVNCPVFPVCRRFIPGKFRQEIYILYRREDVRI